MATTLTTLSGSEAKISDEALDALRMTIRGDVLTPDDPDYATVRPPYNAMHPGHPSLVIRASGVADVIDAVNFARDQGLLIAVRGGGHSVAGLSSIDGGLLIDLGQMNGVDVDPDALRSYGRRAKTRTEHLRLVAKYLGWRLPTTLELKELDEFLLARAMEHDSPTLLFRLAGEYLISVRVIRPGPVTVVERVAHARAEAGRETFDRLAHEFSETRCAALDGLLVTDPEVRMTRLRWLSTGPVEASPAAVKAEVAKLGFLRGLGADTLDLSVLPAERRRFLATVGRRLTAQALERRDPQRRYPILLTVLAQSATDVLDEVVQLFDQSISAR